MLKSANAVAFAAAEEFAALAPLVGARDKSDTLSRLRKLREGQKATSAKIAINQTRLVDLI